MNRRVLSLLKACVKSVRHCGLHFWVELRALCGFSELVVAKYLLLVCFRLAKAIYPPTYSTYNKQITP